MASFNEEWHTQEFEQKWRHCHRRIWRFEFKLYVAWMCIRSRCKYYTETLDLYYYLDLEEIWCPIPVILCFDFVVSETILFRLQGRYEDGRYIRHEACYCGGTRGSESRIGCASAVVRGWPHYVLRRPERRRDRGRCVWIQEHVRAGLRIHDCRVELPSVPGRSILRGLLRAEM